MKLGRKFKKLGWKSQIVAGYFILIGFMFVIGFVLGLINLTLRIVGLQ